MAKNDANLGCRVVVFSSSDSISTYHFHPLSCFFNNKKKPRSVFLLNPYFGDALHRSSNVFQTVTYKFTPAVLFTMLAAALLLLSLAIVCRATRRASKVFGACRYLERHNKFMGSCLKPTRNKMGRNHFAFSAACVFSFHRRLWKAFM